MNTATATPTELLPPPTKAIDPKPNGAGHEESPVLAVDLVRAAIDSDPEVQALRKWRCQLEKLSDRQKSYEAKRPEINDRLDDARKIVRDIEKEAENNDSAIEAVKAEILAVALGGFSEELFDNPTVTSTAKENAITDASQQALQDAFDKMKLSEIGIKPSLASKLEADGISNGKDLRAWIQKVPRRDIQGIGQKSVENLSALMGDKMIAMSQQVAKQLSPPAAALTGPEIIIEKDAVSLLVARIGDGWSSSCNVGLGKGVSFGLSPDKTFPHRVQAIAAACDSINDYLDTIRKPTAKQRKAMKIVLAELDRVDKELAAQVHQPETPADVKTFWAEYVKSDKPAELNAKAEDSDRVPLNQAMGKAKKGRKARKGK